jgi:hypothetical protein
MAITKLIRNGPYSFEYTLLRRLVTVDDTLLLADELGSSIGQLGGPILAKTFDIAYIGLFNSLRLMVYGTDADNDTATMNLYGWHHTGPGIHLGIATMVLSASDSRLASDPDIPGFHGSPETDQSIRDVLLPTVTYRVVDAFTVTANPESALTARNAVDKPGTLEVNLVPGQFDWLAAFFTGLGAAGLALSAMAIYRPISVKPNFWEVTSNT